MFAPLSFLIILCIISIVALIAERAKISFPIAFIVAGILLTLIPGMPLTPVNPEFILVIFLPPLLMEAAYSTSLRDLQFNGRPIFLLAFLLVIVTSFSVGYVYYGMVPDATLALGVVLGAIVSPPDAVAATAILKKAHVPKRVVTILEGESLLNDATGLVLYKFAVAAVVTGSFHLLPASGLFLWMVISGAAIGAGVGWIYMALFPRIQEQSVEILASFIVPYVVYILAEMFDSSGVLAVVTAGLVVGWYGPEKFSHSYRLTAEAIWKMVVFVLNGLVFLLIGLEFPSVLSNLWNYSPATLVWYAIVISVTMIVVRMVWVFFGAYVIRFLYPAWRKVDPYPAWQNVFIIGWIGMRGVVSLAIALALPYTLADGSQFPDRSLIIFLAVAAIFVTLVLQGLTLPWMVRHLKFKFNSHVIFEDWHARVTATKRALKRLEELAAEPETYLPAVERVQSLYQDKLKSLGDGPNTPLVDPEMPDSNNHPIIQAEHKVWKEVLETERETVVSLRKAYTIGDDVMRQILHEIDVLANRVY